MDHSVTCLGILIKCRSILTYPKSYFVLVSGNSQKAIELKKIGGYILLIDETFIVKLFSTTKKTRLCFSYQSLHILTRMFSSPIDYGTACLNSQLNWTCPGGYLQMLQARWETNVKCGIVLAHNEFDVKPNLQNKCNNKSACHFTVEDSSFDGICTNNCERLQLAFGYQCVSKSFA